MNPHSLARAVILAGALALGVALGAQHFGLSPCALCLVARWPYRGAIVAGLLALALPPRYARHLLWLALACLVADAAVAAVQVGVECGWWKSPLAECSAPSLKGLSGADLLRALPARPVTPCDAPVYLIPQFKLSMAAMNLIYATALSLGLGAAMLRGRKA